MPPSIGFIGLGIMGRPMALNLFKAGLRSPSLIALPTKQSRFGRPARRWPRRPPKPPPRRLRDLDCQ